MLYTFGSDYWGCIGCNNELDEEVTSPYRVEFFAEKPVLEVACGECHVVVLTGKLSRTYPYRHLSRMDSFLYPKKNSHIFLKKPF